MVGQEPPNFCWLNPLLSILLDENMFSQVSNLTWGIFTCSLQTPSSPVRPNTPREIRQSYQSCILVTRGLMKTLAIRNLAGILGFQMLRVLSFWAVGCRVLDVAMALLFWNVQKNTGSNQTLGSPAETTHRVFHNGVCGFGLAKCIRIHHDPIRVVLCFSNACGCCLQVGNMKSASLSEKKMP